ncbi:MAG: hypothetical protein N2Z85_03370 [Patescibacteria group bacterium]|nr:hypothetical protein [Patescibacteria group bacterium]
MTLFIKNAKILNIDKNNKLDILISGNKISAIGNFYNKKADKIIDADGSYVSYGFIDIYNELDHNFKIFSSGFDIVQEGVLNVLIGHSGISLVPIFYYFDGFKKYSSGYGINLNWQDLNQFNDFLYKQNKNLNFKTLVGFQNLKHLILRNKNRNLNQKEFLRFLDILNNILKSEILGLSLDWENIELEFLTLKQLENIANTISKNSKILSITLPKEKNIENIVKILINIISKTNVKILLNNYLDGYLNHQTNLNILKLLEQFYPNIFFTLNPYKIENYLIDKFLPLRIKKNSLENILEIISDEWFIKRIINELPNFNLEDILIFQTENNLKHHTLNNKQLKEVMNLYEIDNPKLALLKIMLNTKLRSVIFEKNIDFDILIDALLSKNSFIGSGWIYLDNTKKVFIDYINLILSYKLMNFDNLIQKITLCPAKFLGLKNYDNFQIGREADLVGFDIINNEIKIKFVIYQGKIVILNNKIENQFQKKIEHDSLLN